MSHPGPRPIGHCLGYTVGPDSRGLQPDDEPLCIEPGPSDIALLVRERVVGFDEGPDETAHREVGSAEARTDVIDHVVRVPQRPLWIGFVGRDEGAMMRRAGGCEDRPELVDVVDVVPLVSLPFWRLTRAPSGSLPRRGGRLRCGVPSAERQVPRTCGRSHRNAARSLTDGERWETRQVSNRVAWKAR